MEKSFNTSPEGHYDGAPEIWCRDEKTFFAALHQSGPYGRVIEQQMTFYLELAKGYLKDFSLENQDSIA